MSTHDKQGRAYARLSDLSPGDLVQVDGNLACIKPWSWRKVFRSELGSLCVRCTEGNHGLDGHVDDDNETLIGIYPAGNDMVAP